MRRNFSHHSRKQPAWSMILFFVLLALLCAIIVLAVKDRLQLRALSRSSLSWDRLIKDDPQGSTNLPRFTEVDGVSVIDAPFIDQREKYPTGCESVSAVMALQYLGQSITPDQFIDEYLPQRAAPRWNGGEMVGPDPEQYFLGSPYSEDGWGCYAPVIRKAMEKAVTGRPITVREHRGKSLDWLTERYVEKGVPVLIWATIDMAEPQEGSAFRLEGTEKTFTWVYPTHCLLLIGASETGYFFNDPMAGKAVFYERSAVETAYAALGEQAVAAFPK